MSQANYNKYFMMIVRAGAKGKLSLDEIGLMGLFFFEFSQHPKELLKYVENLKEAKK